MENRVGQMSSDIKNFLGIKNKKYKKLFETEEGKYVLAELYKFAGMDRPSYVEGSSDRTAYNEGMKRVCLHIKGILNQSDSDVDKVLEKYQDSINYNPLS